MADASQRREQLKDLYAEARECRRCPLAETRTNVVFGAGNADAQIMFVGEAPGYHEDRQALPFVGQAGKLLEKLLARIGLERKDVFIANVLKCRPPGNRDPQPEEISLCQEYLEQQIGLIAPLVVCTMGNFSTKLLSQGNDGITRVRGRLRPYPGKEGVRIFPVFHPAAALHMPANLATLEKDFDRLGAIISGRESDDSISDNPPDKLEISQAMVETITQPMAEPAQAQADPEQLGLF